MQQSVRAASATAYPCLESPAAAALVRQPAQTCNRAAFDFGTRALAFHLAVDEQPRSYRRDVGSADLVHAKIGADNL